ncbi:MAG: autotransporter domain-containing protein [Rhodoplanes sp.]|uniref:autotransporter domain-containing protein n=1 Tax=Rhodoplanes sp. TaxID=1968906 RepID=UPI0018100D05|nr:autotransporter domain-containing protein [Rhodoplanes sp.]NVO14791.1 autotransporter domain-containing protein [Rhodoplanes sp.]
MNRHRRSMLKRGVALASLLIGAVSGAQAGPYSNAYFFGDSLTDAGVFAAIPGVGANSHFSTNPGTIWAQNLGVRYGLSVTPSYAVVPTLPVYGFTPIAGGNDFAVGMGRISLAPTGPSYAVGIPPVSTQVDDFLARGPVDRNALYAVSGGHNDVIAQFSAVMGGGTLAAGQAALVTAADDMVAQVTRLQSAGVRNLIVVGIMDISRTPYAHEAAQLPYSAELQSLVSTFNTALVTGLAGKNALYFDTSRLLGTILANPAAYGFTNTTDAACAAALGCPAPAGTGGYLFADPKHPSEGGHRIISDWVYSSLEAANRAGLLSQVAMARAGAQWRSIDSRLQEFENFGYTGQGVFFSTDYSYSKRDASGGIPSGDDSGTNFVIGYEKALNDQMFGGVTLGYGHVPFDYGNNLGSVNYDEWTLSGFGAYKLGAFYANALASYSRLDFASTRRIALGPFNTVESGDTGGNRFAAKGQVGYNFVFGDVVHGPLAGLAWARVDVNGFSENSSSVTAMSYGDQARESLRSRLGWQVAAESHWFGVRVRPYGQLSYDYEHKDDERTYRVGFVGGTSSLEIAMANLTGGYGTMLAGFNAEFSKIVRLGVGASTTFGQPGDRISAVTVTLGAPF